MSLPTGAGVTFLFTDIEGSTRLEQAVGFDAWAQVVAQHDALLRAAATPSSPRAAPNAQGRIQFVAA